MWFEITLLAYFLFAVSSLFDRFILVQSLPKPGAYAFGVALLGILVLPLAPFYLEFPSIPKIGFSILAGAVWILGLFLLYKAIKKSEVSRTVPVVGGLVPLFSLLFSYLLFPNQTELSTNYLVSFLILILGTLLLSYRREHWLSNLPSYILPALTFGLGFLMMKRVYEGQPFMSGYIWMRIGGVAFSSLLLLSPETREEIFKNRSYGKKEVSIPFLLGQITGGLGFLLQNYAVNLSLPSQVPLINALEGSRFIFLLFFVFLIEKIRPQLLKETVETKAMIRKTIGVIMIGTGVAIMAL